VHRPRAELVVLRPLGVPTPHARVDVHRDGGVPSAARLAAALGGAAGRLRIDGRRGLDPALRRPRRRARVRAPLTARRGAAPMRAFVVALLVALAFPAVASAHATLRSTT